MAPTTLGPLGDAVAAAAAAIADAGCDTPRLDGELLAAAAAGVGREQLVLDPGAELDGRARARLRELVARRVEREPVAYILGRRAFRRLELAVDRGVLVPRP